MKEVLNIFDKTDRFFIRADDKISCREKCGAIVIKKHFAELGQFRKWDFEKIAIKMFKVHFWKG